MLPINKIKKRLKQYTYRPGWTLEMTNEEKIFIQLTIGSINIVKQYDGS